MTHILNQKYNIEELTTHLMPPMITAKEADTLTVDKVEGKANSIINELEQKNKIGEYSFVYDFTLDKKVMQLLQDKGYNVIEVSTVAAIYKRYIISCRDATYGEALESRNVTDQAIVLEASCLILCLEDEIRLAAKLGLRYADINKHIRDSTDGVIMLVIEEFKKRGFAMQEVDFKNSSHIRRIIAQW